MQTSQGTVARPAPGGRPLHHRMRRLALCLGVSVVGLSVGLAAPAQAADHIVVGASGDVSGLQSHAGAQLARHVYAKLSGAAQVAQLINIETTVNWSQVAAGSQDADIKRWASALKGQDVMVSFSHEPMSKQNSHWGSSSDFIAAWKHIVNVFDTQGSTSVRWVWNVTSDSFRVPSSSWQYGAKWYPGDSYVDYVAGEAYNKAGCGQSETSFAAKIQQIFAFANEHNKKFVAAEFASNAYSGRAAWINAAHAYMALHKTQFAGAFYYNSTSAGSCNWHLSTSAEFSAIRSLAMDAGFGP
jgi:beta-mannanase